MAVVVAALPAIGGFPELILKAGAGGAVYAALALTLNAAGVRDVALSLIERRKRARATA